MLTPSARDFARGLRLAVRPVRTSLLLAVLALSVTPALTPTSLSVAPATTPATLSMASGLTTAALATASPPACAYGDVLTQHRAYADYPRTLLDTWFRVGSTYAPPGLSSTSLAGLNGGYYVRNLVIADLRAMARAARSAGAPLAVQSAYRSYAYQKTVFQQWVNRYGYQAALKASARPGHSEHQLGTTLDFRSYGNATPPWDYADWGRTKAGAWLRNNGWRYGFVLSYPYGKIAVTCYKYEPWHYRYVGRTQAKAIRDSGLTPRQYLWATRNNG